MFSSLPLKKTGDMATSYNSIHQARQAIDDRTGIQHGDLPGWMPVEIDTVLACSFVKNGFMKSQNMWFRF